MSRRFRKISVADRGYTIIYDQENESHYWAKRSLSSAELARPEFDQSMRKLAPIFVYMCQLKVREENIFRNVGVDEISYVYPKKKPPYLILKGTVDLDNGHTFRLGSPAWSIPSIHDNETQFSKDFFNRLNEVEAEAWRYVDGERAQGVLFAQTNNAENNDVENPMLEDDGDE